MKDVARYIDFVFCLIVLPVMMLIFPVERWFHNFPVYVATVGVWLYGLYWLNRLFTVPMLFAGGWRRRVAIALIVLSPAVTALLAMADLYTPKPNIHDVGITRVFPNVQQYQQAVWSLFMIVETFSFAVGLLIQANIQRARRRAVEAERDKAEIELYKAQIKPHFMFNTLNSLYGLFLTRDAKALESLEMYIAMLRYILTTASRDFVSLSDEVDYIRQYVALQSLRLNGKTTVALEIEVENDSVLVPPMLLVTFVENCFKHGVSPVEESHIHVGLTERAGRLSFRTSNRIFPVKRIGEHMGIDNCRRRLGLLYPGRHTMSIQNDGQTFIVELSIPLSL